MSNIIEHDGNGSVRTVQVGDSGSSVSAKVYQDIYHQVTGRTEQIRKRYSQNLLIEFSEIEQLHHKIMQLCDVHNIVANNEVVSVFHEKERKDQFTSFERFKAYNSNTSSPSVNLVLKYNFSIIPAGLNRPQEYVVNIRLSSRVAIINQMEADAPSFMKGRMLRFLTENTAEVTVDYVDYVIARGFLESFDEWVRGCKTEQENSWLLFLKQWSHFIPELVKFFVATVIIFYAFSSVPDFFTNSPDPQVWARFFIVFGGSFYLMMIMVGRSGSIVENALNSFSTISYLNLNKGDQKLIDDFKRRKNKIFLKFVFGCVITVLLGFMSSQLAEVV